MVLLLQVQPGGDAGRHVSSVPPPALLPPTEVQAEYMKVSCHLSPDLQGYQICQPRLTQEVGLCTTRTSIGWGLHHTHTHTHTTTYDHHTTRVPGPMALSFSSSFRIIIVDFRKQLDLHLHAQFQPWKQCTFVTIAIKTAQASFF